MRHTKAELISVFQSFCKALGPLAEQNYGKLVLDYNAYNGGWRVEGNNGSSLPFGEHRRPIVEMISTLRFATQVLLVSQGKA